MASHPTSLNWVRILVAVVGGYLASFAFLFCVISIFASLLAFQARGAPDQAQIDAFANQHSSWMGSLALFVAAVVAAVWATRRLQPGAAQQHGLIIGCGLGLLAVLSAVIFGGFDLVDLLVAVLTAGAGWAGALLGQRFPGRKGA